MDLLPDRLILANVLTPTVFLCHSDADRSVVEELAGFLERGAGLDICVEEGRIRPGEDLIAAVTRALQADAVLAGLSPDSSPQRWALEKWTAAFQEQPRSLGVRVATVLCRECKFPPLLRRENFFDLTGNPLDGFRRIKQWLLRLRPAAERMFFAPRLEGPCAGVDDKLEELRRLLGDAPGTAAVTSGGLAAEFAGRFCDDFEGVFWVRCGERSAARVAGELASQLGLRLEGDTASNQEELRRFCSARRCLIVLDDVRSDAPLALAPGERASVLITTERRDLPWPLIEAPAIDAPLVYLPSDASIAGLEEALHAGLSRADDAEGWRLACSLARRLVALTRAEGRLAEADEFLQMWFSAAEQRADRRVLEECAWERRWILEKWGRVEEARKLDAYRRSVCQDQICFDFISA